MFQFLDRLADEGHSSERVAGWYHLIFVGLYFGAIVFHLWTARRHFDAADEKRS